MAYNPDAFETVYGFSLLDELHNFFPELLYDETLFTAESVRWMRHRIHTLFPRVYTRQTNSYSLYNGANRLREYAQWHHDNIGVGDTPPPLSRIARSTHANVAQPPPDRTPATPQIPSLTAATLLPPRAPIRTRSVMEQPAGRTAYAPFTNLFSSVLMDIPFQDSAAADLPAQNLLNFFNLAFQDVIVAPTEVEINIASTLRNNDDVPEETVCSICQEHGSEHPWRILACNHYYHRPCIDRWFQSHTQCPVCRADVRTLRATHGTPS